MFKKFIVPSPLKKGSKIGITGPSGGVKDILHPRLDFIIQHLKNQGFEIKEGQCLRDEFKHVSAEKSLRAKELQSFLLDDELDAICPPWGGEILIEILPMLDFEKIAAAKPKWITSYSDISTLHFATTLMTGICTAHTPNLMDLAPANPESTDKLTDKVFEILQKSQGEVFEQVSSEFYQQGARIDIVDNPAAVFTPDKKTKWKSLRNEQQLNFKGRLIGGCLDTIFCLTGTPYGNMEAFKKVTKDEGHIFYFENCEGRPTDVVRRLENIKQAGWLEGANGMLIGRSCGKDTSSDQFLSYEEALHQCLEELNIPVVYDADVGHCPPQMTLINGAIGEIEFTPEKSKLKQILKP